MREIDESANWSEQALVSGTMQGTAKETPSPQGFGHRKSHTEAYRDNASPARGGASSTDGNELSDAESMAPTNTNVLLTSHALNKEHRHAGRQDSRFAGVRQTMAADLRESDEEMLMNLPVSSPEKHAKAARVRPGPRRVDAAGESKKGRDFASQVPGRGGLEMRMPPEKTSIFDLPDSDTD